MRVRRRADDTLMELRSLGNVMYEGNGSMIFIWEERCIEHGVGRVKISHVCY